MAKQKKKDVRNKKTALNKRKTGKKSSAKKNFPKNYLIIGGIVVLLALVVVVVALSGDNGQQYTPRPQNGDTNGNTGVFSFTQAVAKGVETGHGAGDLEGDDPWIGSSDAKVVVVEFSDFECPYCGASAGTNKKVMDYLKGKMPGWTPAVPNMITDYISQGKVRFVFRDFPSAAHPHSQKAAEASECADDQGKYWEYHEVLFEHSDVLAVDDLKAYAAELGLDTAAFDECLDSGKYADETKQDMQDGVDNNVRGTPTYFINGRIVAGAQPYSAFKTIIDEELAK